MKYYTTPTQGPLQHEPDWPEESAITESQATFYTPNSHMSTHLCVCVCVCVCVSVVLDQSPLRVASSSMKQGHETFKAHL